MKVTCTASSQGPVYRCYRSGADFVHEMRGLIPFLTASGCELSVGGSEDDPEVVLIVGPLTELVDTAFRARVSHFLVS